FRCECIVQKACSSDVATRSVDAGNETKFDRVTANREDDRNGRRCGFGRERRRGALDRNDRGYFAANQISRQRKQSVQLTLGPAVLHCDIAAFDVAGFVETLPDRVELAGSFTVRAAEQADHRHRRLLRARRERLGGCRAAEQRYELAAPYHSITSSARASSDGGTSRLRALAATRLKTSSNLVGCSTGRCAGFAPRRILST